MRWEPGRQGSGYYKLKLFQSRRLALDCYLLHYPDGVGIPMHNDAITGRKHYRLNVVLLRGEGGRFYCKWPIFITSRIKVFRSDYPHFITPVIGRRLVLSFGWAPHE